MSRPASDAGLWVGSICGFLLLIPMPAAAQSTSYPGWQPAAGCSCRDPWIYAGQTFSGGVCASPDGDADGPWCYTTAICNGRNWSYCRPPTTCAPNPFSGYVPRNGTCKDTWTYNGQTFCGGQCGNPDNDVNGPWCFTQTVQNGG